MKVKDLDGLFAQQVKDLYGAEKKLTKALTKMSKAASDESLRTIFQEHGRESEKQIERLEDILKECNVNTRGAKCPAMDGLIEEAEEFLHNEMEAEVLDAALICSAQRVEHYEIAAYGCARAIAEQLGRDDLAKELGTTLEEEKRANEKLNELALGRINQEAMQMSGNGDRDPRESEEY